MAPTLPVSVAVGTPAEFRCFADGWHERQRDGRCAVLYRAARETGRIVLARDPAARRLCLLVSGPVGLSPQGVLRGEALVDGCPHPLELCGDWWAVRRFDLAPTTGDSIAVALSLPEPPCPDDVLRNGDRRRLGWYVGAAWQC